MTFEQAMQLLGVLGSIVGTAVSARWGNKALSLKIEQGDAALMTKLERDYVTLESHRAAVTELHRDKNALASEVAALKGERAAQQKLDEKQDAEISFLKAAFLAITKTEAPQKPRKLTDEDDTPPMGVRITEPPKV